MKIKKEKIDIKNNIVFLFIKMLILFCLLDIVISYLPSYISSYIIKGKYATHYIVESIALIFALIAVILAGNSYIFKNKKNNFLESLAVGVFPIGLALCYFIPNIVPAIRNSVTNVASLLAYCIAIGLFEEFICRGWIQTEFIERYSENIKQVIISILLSSLIFGFMHISNIWFGGQTIFATLMQIIHATGMGFLLGAIFFRTKNIWGVAFIHAFWDFSIMLTDSMSVKSCTTGTLTSSILRFEIMTTLIYTIIYILIGLYILRLSKTNDNFEDKTYDEKKDNNLKSIITIIVIVLFALPINIDKEEYNNYNICYEYDKITFNNYEVVYPKVSNQYIDYIYNVDDDNVTLPVKLISDDIEIDDEINIGEERILSLSLYSKDNKAYIIDNIIDKEYELDYTNVYKTLVVTNNDNTYIIIVTRDPKSGESKVYFNDYINSTNLSKDDNIETIIREFKEYNNMPVIYNIGYIHDLDTNNNYPLFESRTDSLVINNEEVLVIK